ncbi:DUF4186 family protein [Escherichia coli]
MLRCFPANQEKINLAAHRQRQRSALHPLTREFVGYSVNPALPANDGKQTPMRGHPVFIAQHATATCCRGCLAKWHNIPQGVSLSEEQQRYIVAVIYHWLVVQMNQP